MTDPIAAVCDLDAILARSAAATPGPWISPWDKLDGVPDGFGINDCDHFTSSAGDEVVSVIWYDGPNLGVLEPDATFIAHARTDVPAMAAEIKALRARVEDLE